MINKLPVELALSIIAYLPIRFICSLQLVCRALNHTIKTNESQIYHAAAVYMGWIPSANCTLENVSSIYALSGIHDWKSLCGDMHSDIMSSLVILTMQVKDVFKSKRVGLERNIPIW